MFGFLQSPERKMRENADSWLQLADKIGHYRRDELTAAQAQALRAQCADLRLLLRQRADADRLKLGIEALEGVLRPIGGTFYPKSAMVENVEFFLVAAIIVLGIRTFFVQPFKIPTNSMWPTYYGMTAENLPPGAPAPGPLETVFRFFAFGAQRRTAVAPTDGEISAKFFGSGIMAFTIRPAHKWLVVPTQVKEYTFYVDGAEATVQVPVDFGEDFDRVVRETLLGGVDGATFLQQAVQQRRAERSEILLHEGGDDIQPAYLVRLGRTVRAGDPIIRFDLLTGDQLFVDRVSYHFVPPKIGDGFVFRTRNIPLIGADQYYVKRLVGLPGDTLEIRPPVLYRNGQPITGADAFRRNANRIAPYQGYTSGRKGGFNNLGWLAPGETLTVEPHVFFALGDNSRNSQDGRYWGFVPEKDVVGRPLFIYFPFTRRWGPAR